MNDGDTLSEREFDRLCRWIYERAGISLNSEKKIMLEGRLKRRMSSLRLDSYSDYCAYVFADNGESKREMVHLIDAVTTNKTDFFREKAHFDFLTGQGIAALTAGAQRELFIWSAGCSTGEEPYTLAMVLSEYAQSHPGFRWRLLATDISTAVLAKAEMGIYPAPALDPVPIELRRKYFMVGRDRDSPRVRVIPELRSMVEFRQLNLMEDFALAEPADAIFCRNVVIYFDRPTQERLFCRFSRQLAKGGFLFVGHSESLHQMNVPLVPVAPALYRKSHA
ncbi:MAG: protein-glutamate O-methyltransferase CheR [Terriglobales bacterium]